MKKILIFIPLILIIMIPFISFAGDASSDVAKQRPVITMITSLGDITIELWNDIAPKTVENFIGLADGTKEWIDPKTNEKVKRPF